MTRRRPSPALVAAACSGKERYPNGTMAWRVMRRWAKGGQPYRCPVCGGWHIGASTEAASVRDRRRFIEEGRV